MLNQWLKTWICCFNRISDDQELLNCCSSVGPPVPAAPGVENNSSDLREATLSAHQPGKGRRSFRVHRSTERKIIGKHLRRLPIHPKGQTVQCLEKWAPAQTLLASVNRLKVTTRSDSLLFKSNTTNKLSEIQNQEFQTDQELESRVKTDRISDACKNRANSTRFLTASPGRLWKCCFGMRSARNRGATNKKYKKSLQLTPLSPAHSCETSAIWLRWPLNMLPDGEQAAKFCSYGSKSEQTTR